VNRTALIVLVSVFASLMAACQHEKPTPSSTRSAASTTAPVTPEAGERDAEFIVEGMHCATCPITVRTAAKSVPGVLDAQVTTEPGRARIRYRASETDPARIAAAITESGYPAREGAK